MASTTEQQRAYQLFHAMSAEDSVSRFLADLAATDKYQELMHLYGRSLVETREKLEEHGTTQEYIDELLSNPITQFLQDKLNSAPDIQEKMGEIVNGMGDACRRPTLKNAVKKIIRKPNASKRKRARVLQMERDVIDERSLTLSMARPGRMHNIILQEYERRQQEACYMQITESLPTHTSAPHSSSSMPNTEPLPNPWL